MAVGRFGDQEPACDEGGAGSGPPSIGEFGEAAARSSFPVVVIDAEGEISHANEAAARAWGDRSGSVPCRLWSRVVPDDAIRLRDLVGALGRSCGGSTLSSVGLLRDDGSRRRYDVLLTSLPGTPTIAGVVAVFRAAPETPAAAADVEVPGRASFDDDRGGRADLEEEIRRGLARDEFDVFYQPIVSLSDGRPTGAEALVRWHHPERGLVGPDAFIPAAEAEGGLIEQLGRRIVDKAFAQFGSWRGAATASFTLHVNLSVRQLLHPALVEEVVAAAKHHGVDAGRVVFEMTESALVVDHAGAVAAVEGLVGAGFRIAIDDIGIGYSNLLRLKQFPIDILKIDRSFVGGIGRDPRDAAIVGSVVFLAETLGLEVVAEGVETEEQRASLLALGCRWAQGHLFAPALPAAEFRCLLPHPHETVRPAMRAAAGRRRKGSAAAVIRARERRRLALDD